MLTWLTAFALAQDPTGVLCSVVGFPDRAAVTRTVEADVGVGVTQVRFDNLPPTLDLRSLQAEGSGVDGARILGLDIQTRELAEDRRERVSELEAEILSVQDEVTEHNHAVEAAHVELEFLRRVQAASAEQLSAELLFAEETVADVVALADLLETRIPEVQTRIREAERKIRDLRVQIAALQRELGTVRGLAQWSRRDVVVELESSAAGAATVALTYVLPGASWTPSYDARAFPDESKVELMLHALVTQTTGEDWSDISLTLSTAQPSRGVAPPELDPFWLGRPVYEPYGDGLREEKGKYFEDADDDVGMESDKREADAPVRQPMAVATAEVEERPVATTFVVGQATSVPGDGTRRKLRVTTATLDGEFLHVAVPRVEEAAYLVSRSTWEQGWPLLAGTVSAFLGDAFVGTMPLGQVGKGGEVELAFGRDDAIVVEQVVVDNQTSNPDWMGKIIHERSWAFTVTNGRKTASHVEIRDRVPQSPEQRWRVIYTGDEPDEQVEGVTSFARDVGPGASESVNFGYRVRYPRRYPPGAMP
jgi:uncharacterized protein (TIGR02231 family)